MAWRGPLPSELNISEEMELRRLESGIVSPPLRQPLCNRVGSGHRQLRQPSGPHRHGSLSRQQRLDRVRASPMLQKFMSSYQKVSSSAEARPAAPKLSDSSCVIELDPVPHDLIDANNKEPVISLLDDLSPELGVDSAESANDVGTPEGAGWSEEASPHSVCTKAGNGSRDNSLCPTRVRQGYPDNEARDIAAEMQCSDAGIHARSIPKSSEPNTRISTIAQMASPSVKFKRQRLLECTDTGLGKRGRDRGDAGDAGDAGVRTLPFSEHESLSQIRLGQRWVSDGQLRKLLESENCRMLTLPSLAAMVLSSNILWATVGILTRIEHQTKNGTPCVRWTLSDLGREQEARLHVWLQGEAYQHFGRDVSRGAVICILAPKVLTRMDDYRPTNMVISCRIDQKDKLLQVGYAAGLGRCHAKESDGSRCEKLVLKSLGPYCQGHHAEATSLTCTDRPDVMRNQPVPQARLSSIMRRKESRTSWPSAPLGLRFADRFTQPRSSSSNNEPTTVSMHADSSGDEGDRIRFDGSRATAERRVVDSMACHKHQSTAATSSNATLASSEIRHPTTFPGLADEGIASEGPPAREHPPVLNERNPRRNSGVILPSKRESQELRAEIMKRPASSAGARNLVAGMAMSEREDKRTFNIKRDAKLRAAGSEKDERTRRETIFQKNRARITLHADQGMTEVSCPRLDSRCDISRPVASTTLMGERLGSASGLSQEASPSAEPKEVVLLESGLSDDDEPIDVEPPQRNVVDAREQRPCSWERHLYVAGESRMFEAEIRSLAVGKQKVIEKFLSAETRQNNEESISERLMDCISNIVDRNARDNVRRRS